MKTLKEALTEMTQDLKVKYIAQVVEWATKRFAELEKINGYKELDWCKHFGLVAELVNGRLQQNLPITESRRLQATYNPNLKLQGSEFWGMPRNFYNSPDARKQRTLQNEARYAVKVGAKCFIEVAEMKAVIHYETSIDKLVERLAKKGINTIHGDGVKIEKGWVGVNLELTIIAGSTRVKAWTIVAEGEVQRPHYRYLVK